MSSRKVLGPAAGFIDGNFGQVDTAEVLKGLPQKHIFLKEKAGWFGVERGGVDEG
ncbi:hypothetical protein RJZ57_008617 [Blastomyces gilchristii]